MPKAVYRVQIVDTVLTTLVPGVAVVMVRVTTGADRLTVTPRLWRAAMTAAFVDAPLTVAMRACTLDPVPTAEMTTMAWPADCSSDRS